MSKPLSGASKRKARRTQDAETAKLPKISTFWKTDLRNEAAHTTLSVDSDVVAT